MISGFLWPRQGCYRTILVANSSGWEGTSGARGWTRLIFTFQLVRRIAHYSLKLILKFPYTYCRLLWLLGCVKLVEQTMYAWKKIIQYVPESFSIVKVLFSTMFECSDVVEALLVCSGHIKLNRAPVSQGEMKTLSEMLRLHPKKKGWLLRKVTNFFIHWCRHRLRMLKGRRMAARVGRPSVSCEFRQLTVFRREVPQASAFP